jgi:alkylated DNA repair dioxygenase AlkB
MTTKTNDNQPWKYYAHAIDSENAKRYYRVLSSKVGGIVEKFGRPTITIAGREKIEPRLKAYFSVDNESYTYSNAEQKSHGWLPELQELAELGSQLVPGHKFTRALVNWYRDGQDCIGKHNDKDALDEYILSFTCYPSDPLATSGKNNPPISNFFKPKSTTNSLSSLKKPGKADSRRRFIIRPMSDHSNTTTILMDQGCVIIMKPGMQKSYLHEVPRSKAITMGRINITLRESQFKSSPSPSPAGAASSIAASAGDTAPPFGTAFGGSAGEKNILLNTDHKKKVMGDNFDERECEICEKLTGEHLLAPCQGCDQWYCGLCASTRCDSLCSECNEWITCNCCNQPKPSRKVKTQITLFLPQATQVRFCTSCALLLVDHLSLTG